MYKYINHQIYHENLLAVDKQEAVVYPRNSFSDNIKTMALNIVVCSTY